MHVLYVEDHEATVLVLQHRCKTVEIDVAASLFDAKARLLRDRFDVLLVDLNLPDSTGMATVRALMDYDVPMVVLTGDTSNEFRAEAWRLGVADYISKKHLLDVDIEDRLKEAHANYQRIKRRYSRLSFGNLDAMKSYISCPPFATISRSNRSLIVA
jgi:hypothetical protein